MCQISGEDELSDRKQEESTDEDEEEEDDDHERHRRRSQKSRKKPRHSSGVLTESSQHNRKNRRIHQAEEDMAPRNKNAAQKKRDREEAERKAQEDRVIERQRQQLEKLQQENERLQQEKEALTLKKSARKSTGNQLVLSLNNGVKDQVILLSGKKGQCIWRTTKFLANESQLLSVCHQVMLEIPETKVILDGKDGPELKQILKAFSKSYGNALCTAINDARSEVQSGLKTAYLERSGTGASMPNSMQLLNVILRKGMNYPEEPEDIGSVEDYESEEDFKAAEEQYKTDKAQYELKVQVVKRNREWFRWYWTCLLPKATGNGRWGASIRNWGCISDHAPPDSPGKKYVTSSDEALIAVTMENCAQRFPYLAALKNGQSFDRYAPEYQSAYTCAESGSQKFGGWSLEGRARYTDMLAWIRKAKKNGRSLALEREILAEIQEELGIEPGDGKKKKARVVMDFENDARAHAPVGVESDAMSEIDDDESDELQTYTITFRAPPKKKPKKDKKKSSGKGRADDGSASESD